jgi:hypothetical protein
MDTYIKIAFEELLHEDGLAVMAKGMGIQRLLIKFLQYYSMPQSIAENEKKPKLVFCINAHGMEESILNGLLAEGLMPHQLPKVIYTCI